VRALHATNPLPQYNTPPSRNLPIAVPAARAPNGSSYATSNTTRFVYAGRNLIAEFVGPWSRDARACHP
jgi:hypothetical protein